MDRLCWILWILLMFPVIRSESSAESDCGFPGLPLDGSVEVYTVNRGYSTVTTQDWAPAKVGHYVFYRCAAQDLRVEYTQRTESRRCESGRWTQHVPICGKFLSLSLVSNYKLNMWLQLFETCCQFKNRLVSVNNRKNIQRNWGYLV